MNESIDLEAAKAAFFASGGSICLVPGFEIIKPMPTRIDAGALPEHRKSTRPRKAEEQAHADVVDRLRTLGKRLALATAAKEMDMSREVVSRLANKYGIEFQIRSIKDRPEDDPALITRVLNLVQVGLTRRQIGKHLSLNEHTVRRIIREAE